MPLSKDQKRGKEIKRLKKEADEYRKRAARYHSWGNDELEKAIDIERQLKKVEGNYNA